MICITFDTDWMSDQAMSEFLEKVQWPGEATFFLHQHLPSLHDTNNELCPHPFISDLEDWEGPLLQQAMQIPGRGKGIRPHSCVFSHMLGIRFAQLGYEYVSQATCLYQPGMMPFRHPWGLWELPIYYMDSMDLCMGDNWKDIEHVPFKQSLIAPALKASELYVFDFHPIHLALNTSSHADYASVKQAIIDGEVSPFDLASPGRGARSLFDDLCDAMSEAGEQSYSCSSAINHFKNL